MSKWEKRLEAMRTNPAGDWVIDDLLLIAGHLGIHGRRQGGSHVSFSHELVERIITPPAHRPIKVFYIKQFVAFADEVITAMDEEK